MTHVFFMLPWQVSLELVSNVLPVRNQSNKYLTHLPACVFKREIFAISSVFVNNNNYIPANGNLSVSSSKHRMYYNFDNFMVE